jgi:hypothetical protein
VCKLPSEAVIGVSAIILNDENGFLSGKPMESLLANGVSLRDLHKDLV